MSAHDMPSLPEEHAEISLAEKQKREYEAGKKYLDLYIGKIAELARDARSHGNAQEAEKFEKELGRFYGNPEAKEVKEPGVENLKKEDLVEVRRYAEKLLDRIAKRESRDGQNSEKNSEEKNTEKLLALLVSHDIEAQLEKLQPEKKQEKPRSAERVEEQAVRQKAQERMTEIKNALEKHTDAEPSLLDRVKKVFTGGGEVLFGKSGEQEALRVLENGNAPEKARKIAYAYLQKRTEALADVARGNTADAMTEQTATQTRENPSGARMTVLMDQIRTLRNAGDAGSPTLRKMQGEMSAPASQEIWKSEPGTVVAETKEAVEAKDMRSLALEILVKRLEAANAKIARTEGDRAKTFALLKEVGGSDEDAKKFFDAKMQRVAAERAAILE